MSNPKPPDPLCARCHHPESEHGKTGTHPCLSMVGTLLDRDFCTCDQFRLPLRKAA